MLWTDAVFVSQTDLLSIDSEVQEVAASDTNPIDIPNDVIATAINECGVEILVDMQQFGGMLSSGGLSGNHLSAVYNTGSMGINRTRVNLGQIVVDHPRIQSVKTWVVYSALALLYRNAHARTSNDRYRDKMEHYHSELLHKYKPRLRSLGLPVVARPLACPGAVKEHAGSWDATNVTAASAAGAAGGTYFLAVSYVDQSVYQGPAYGLGAGATCNAQSNISAPVQIITPANQAPLINISSLIPPNGAPDPRGSTMHASLPYKATGWNVFAASSAAGPFFLQNSTPIPIATLTYACPTDPVLSGFPPVCQWEDAWLTIQELLQRG